MKTRLLIIIIGLSVAGIFGVLYTANVSQNSEDQNAQEEWRELRESVMNTLGKQKACNERGGTWNTDHCLVTQEIIDSNKLTCDPGPVMENNTCQSNGMTFVVDSPAVYSKFADGVTTIINPEHEPLKYRNTPQVIDDTYLSKDVEQWQRASQLELDAGYQKYGDDFYTELGRLLMKNEMQYQMNSLGITNADGNFEVVSGMALQSLPPHIDFSSIVHATDGHYYLLSGTTHANRVNYYKTIQLQYPDESRFPVILSIALPELPDNRAHRISITETDGTDLRAEPYNIILSQPGGVEFYNKTPQTLTVYLNKEGAKESSLAIPDGISTRSNSGMAFTFDEPGVYSFHAKVPKDINGEKYELNTGGTITVLADDLGDLPKKVQVAIAKQLLASSELPITSMGQRGTDDVIYIGLDHSIEQLLPESKPYYLRAAQHLVPFEIKIALED